MPQVIRLHGARIVAGSDRTGILWSFHPFPGGRHEGPTGSLAIEAPRMVEVYAPDDARVVQREGLSLCEFADPKGRSLAISAFRLATFAAAEVYGFRFRDHTNVLNAPFGFFSD